jgi:large subunit ribosomal protein L10e
VRIVLQSVFRHELTRSGQVIMSIRCRDSNRAVIIEALRRARYKFPGRQKIIVSKKWGFTSLDRPDYEALKRDKQVINDGAYVQVSCRLRCL